MKQTIEIEVPDGKKAIWKDNKIVFENITSNLPKTWDEFCKFHPIVGDCYIGRTSNIKPTDCYFRDYINDRSLLPSSEAAEAHLALMQLHQLRDCYRQGWRPDYTNTSNKFCIIRYFDLNTHKCDYKITDLITFSFFLSFQSKEIAEKFLDNFKDLIKQAGDLI